MAAGQGPAGKRRRKLKPSALDKICENNYYYKKHDNAPRGGGAAAGENRREKTMRYSRQRELVMRQVQSRCDHPTADEIYTAVRDDCPGLSLGTVYRNLNGLVEAGRVRRVSVPGQADRFDRTLADHDHMFCTRCGRVEDVQLDKTPLDKMIAGRPELAIESYALTLYGVCSACREASGS